MGRERDLGNNERIIERAKLHIEQREQVTIATVNTIEAHQGNNRSALPRNIQKHM